MAEAVDQGFLRPVALEADRTGARHIHLKGLLLQAFSAMGAGRLELPQSCDLRILSPSKTVFQTDF